MNKRVSKAIAAILSSVLAVLAASGCAVGNGGLASSGGESTASVQSADEADKNRTESGEQSTEQSFPTETSENSLQNSGQAAPQTSMSDTLVCDTSAFSGLITRIEQGTVTQAYYGTNMAASGLTLVIYSDDIAVLIAGRPEIAEYAAAVCGKIKLEAEMDTYDSNGFGAVYSITNDASQKITFSLTGTKTGEGSDRVSINIDGIDDVYSCRRMTADEAAGLLREHYIDYINSKPTTPAPAPEPSLRWLLEETEGIQQSDITFAIVGETETGAELLYIEVADGTKNGKAIVLSADGSFDSEPVYTTTIYGRCSNPEQSEGDSSSAAISVTGAAGNTVHISVTKADEPGMFYAAITDTAQQFIAEQISAEESMKLLYELGASVGIQQVTSDGSIDASDESVEESDID